MIDEINPVGARRLPKQIPLYLIQVPHIALVVCILGVASPSRRRALHAHHRLALSPA